MNPRNNRALSNSMRLNLTPALAAELQSFNPSDVEATLADWRLRGLVTDGDMNTTRLTPRGAAVISREGTL